MTPKLKKFLCLSIPLALATFSLTRPVFASLGGDATTVESDRARLQAQVRITSNDRYAIHEMQAPNNVVIREFVAPTGKVFGVAWQGPVRPDLQQLLGSYFDTFTEAAKTERLQHPARGPLTIHQNGLVVELSGHPRAFVGRAYVSGMVPANVRAEEIQ